MKKWVLISILILLASPVHAFTSLDDVNQKVCDRFEEEVSRLAAIMEELRRRKGIVETRVAFGGIDDQIKSADYWITYAAEAIAYHRAQNFLGKQQLRSSLEVLRGKVSRAKNEVGRAIEN